LAGVLGAEGGGSAADPHGPVVGREDDDEHVDGRSRDDPSGAAAASARVGRHDR